jgi:hypothetical protein
MTIASFFTACGENKANQPSTLFTEVPATQSHIDFSNTITEDKDYNILTYEYLYNGGGAAAGDLNNDGLADLVFSGNMTPLRLYLNKGGLQFEDVSTRVGFSSRTRWRTGIVMADVNGDGLLDIFVSYSGPGSDADRVKELYINDGIKDGVPHFTESAKKYGLDAPGTFTTTVSFFDMDNDGDLDLFMVNHGDMFFNPDFNTDRLRATRNLKFGNRLYRNDGGVFTDVSDSAHIDGSGLNFGLGVAISDINNDGWADIYVTNDYDERDFLYLNDHQGHFREVLRTAAGHISEFAMGVDIADYNNDGLTDIFVLDMLPEDNHRQKLLRGGNNYDKYTMRDRQGFHRQLMRNTLQLNNGMDTSGAPIFSEIGQMAGVSSTDWSWAPLFADFDNDGWKDLFISNGILRDMTNLDFVKYTSGYSNNYVGQKADKEEMWELVKDMPTTKLNSYLFRNNRDLSFSNKTAEWGLTHRAVSNGAVYADLDNDGDLDLVINNVNDQATLYRNNLVTADHAASHYVRLKLAGDRKNTSGIGAKVYVRTAGGEQWQEQYTSRGFQSSVDPVMHIGLGRDSLISLLRVEWPGGKVTSMENVRGDTLLKVEERNAVAEKDKKKEGSKGTRYADITAGSGLDYVHQQSAAVDFKITPLLPYQVSRMGPSLAKGDVNGDGLEDLFIGGSAGFDSRLYLQTGEGKFMAAADQPWNLDKGFTNADALFFDADGDGDADLYLVSGGADHPLQNKHYQDRIFENDGHGHFKELKDALPPETVSGGCVRAADVNRDGLPDLFVGGRLSPGQFPIPPESWIWKNVSSPGHIRFERDGMQSDSVLAHPGMVTDAAWLDLNKDGWPDLVVAGQFMPVTIFENEKGRLTDKTAAYGLSGTRGWWSRLLAADINGDGDTDLVIGNLGLNTFFKAGPQTPLSICYSDFNGDGLLDPVLCLYNQGKEYPYFSRDEILEQIPSLQKKIARYANYADAQLGDLFSTAELAAAHKAGIDMLQSVCLIRGKGRTWQIHPLPEYAQMTIVNGMLPSTIEGSRDPGLIIAGDFYPFRAQMGPLDAGIGLVLKGDGKGAFTPVPYASSGLCIRGDVRALIRVNGRKGSVIVAATNNGPLQVLTETKQ